MRLVVVFGLAVCAVCASAAPQDYRTTPVPILKQINRHNDDGSYSFGYEGADGTFKIETKYPNGEVHGKYGYVGDDGKLREIEYGASKRGFEPSGADINVAPPTLSNSIEETNGNFDDGQYREDPSIYYKTSAGSKTATQRPQYYRPAATQQQYYQPQPQYYQPQPQTTNQYYQPQSQSTNQYYQPQSQTTNQYYQPQSQSTNQYYQQQPRFAPQQYYQPFQFTYDPAIFNGHPATNFDINTGSYSLSYTG